MPDAPAPALKSVWRSIAAATPGLTLLLLFGSRARGDARPASDWDFGYLASPEADIDAYQLLFIRTACDGRRERVPFTVRIR